MVWRNLSVASCTDSCNPSSRLCMSNFSSWFSSRYRLPFITFTFDASSICFSFVFRPCFNMGFNSRNACIIPMTFSPPNLASRSDRVVFLGSSPAKNSSISSSEGPLVSFFYRFSF